MGSITRDRGCLYYVPWLATLCVIIAVTSLGVWAYFTKRCEDLTLGALDDLGISAKELNRINPALVATAITYLSLTLVIYFMSLWRSFIEANHDATGVTGGGALAFLVLSFLLLCCWWLVVVWLVLLVMANTVWAAALYVTHGASKQALAATASFGAATWLPSSDLPCPGQCLDLTQLVFMASELQDACICDTDKLAAARDSFKHAYNQIPGLAVGNWGMLAAGVWLLMNFACQFSHTKREREILIRVATRIYSGI
ncbi:hypothetical protein Agub_g10196 [Astrephomene gubernaculifera]|uniref:Uncharacterized protein n=1 Tax=Astrephomene gubernaculifera TaxID=47775 RepID=A0AAD3DUG2_9CHLO|nr:hypothetical protein Agub_g10196 [Astrephomene gubernaculifera]